MSEIICHRGASAYAPENTIAAFDCAYELGGRFIEFDVMLSRDGEAFIFHDERLRRTTNGKGEFGLVNSDYIQTLDAGSWFSKRFQNEKIPTFRDTLSWLLKKEVQANIEIKPYKGTLEQTTITVLSQLNCYWPADKKLPLVSSFELDVLTLCRSLSPELPLGLLLDNWDKDWLKKARDLSCYSIHLSRRIAKPSFIQEIKSHGYLVYVYTVNHKKQAMQLFHNGVDAIFSDYPDILGTVNED